MGTTPSRRLPPVLTAALAAVLVTGAVAAPAHASRPSARMPVTALAPSLTTRATQATRTAFEGELARNKLRVITLGVHEHELAQGLSYDASGAAVGTAVKKNLATAEGTFVAAETQWSGNPGSPAAWEFVQDEHGDVFRLMRKPLAAITPASLCTCREQKCGPPGSGCPACGSTNQTMYGPLPSGAQYRGEIEVAYQANVVSLEYKEQGCPPAPECPQPP